MWCVTNGRASAPPAIGCIIGVSTSRNAALVEEPADRAHDRRALLEDVARLRVHGEVEVPLPVAALDVLQPVPLLRQGLQALGEEGELGRLDGQLPRARAEHLPGDADPVAEVERPEERPSRLADGVLPDVDLEPRAAVGEVEERRPFPGCGCARIRPATAHGLGRGLELLARARREPRRRARETVRRRGEAVGIDVPDERADLLEVVAPVLDERLRLAAPTSGALSRPRSFVHGRASIWNAVGRLVRDPTPAADDRRRPPAETGDSDASRRSQRSAVERRSRKRRPRPPADLLPAFGSASTSSCMRRIDLRRPGERRARRLDDLGRARADSRADRSERLRLDLPP